MLKIIENTGIVELLYNWNEVITLLLGLVINIILYFANKEKKSTTKLILCVSTISICLSVLIVQVKRNYTYVPYNLWENMPFTEARSRIINCDLCCSDENIQWDLLAQEKIAEGVSPGSISFRVNTIDPVPGAFVRRNSEISLSVTWKQYDNSDGESKNSETEETPVPSESDEPAQSKPSAADLDAINANIVYPRKEEYYLSEYITKYVQASGNRRAVYAFINPNKQAVMAVGNYFRVYNGTEVTVIAQSSGYACVIIPSMNRAAWINSIYLIDG